ncbi:MAG: HAMP domain-containing histidine kinase, partial [Planctomycetes bacterium]|nr:HAMP domain-containing histidine kinase [Planctomycetota bacterium]
SHELRTPLTSIRAYSEILSEFTADESPEARNEFLRVISGESERLTRLVDDLLDLARMESGVEHWEPELVDLRRVLELCLVCLGGLTIEKLVTFTLHAERSHVVEGNADRLQQAFTNVLANAWRFSPAGADIEVTLTGQGPRCTVLVRDRGPGVAEDLRERVFDRFMRDNRGTDPGDGSSTGLGLSITREIVARHRGRIWCENHPDGGAVFAIDLPRATAVGASLDDR